MSKVDEIKADLAVYEKELAEHDRYIQDATDRGELVWGNYPRQKELNKAWDALHRNTPDYLRLLLPIAEAVLKLEIAIDGAEYRDYSKRAAQEELIQALAKLKE